MKLQAENLLWLLVLLPALPLAVNTYLDKTYAASNLAAGNTMEYNWLQKSQQDFAPVMNQAYLAECGSCHFAFQPGLLPKRSWEKVMHELDNHFGDNAGLDSQTQQAILHYLTIHSAEHSKQLRSQHLLASIRPGEIPMRITDTLYFKRKHHQIPEQIVKGNPAIGSFSNCNNCHRHADAGFYNEHDVLIPNTNRIASTMQ